MFRLCQFTGDRGSTEKGGRQEIKVQEAGEQGTGGGRFFSLPPPSLIQTQLFQTLKVGTQEGTGFAKSRPVARGSPATRRPSSLRATARNGPAAQRPSPDFPVLLFSSKSMYMLKFALGLGVQNGPR